MCLQRPQTVQYKCFIDWSKPSHNYSGKISISDILNLTLISVDVCIPVYTKLALFVSICFNFVGIMTDVSLNSISPFFQILSVKTSAEDHVSGITLNVFTVSIFYNRWKNLTSCFRSRNTCFQGTKFLLWNCLIIFTSYPNLAKST